MTERCLDYPKIQIRVPCWNQVPKTIAFVHAEPQVHTGTPTGPSENYNFLRALRIAKKIASSSLEGLAPASARWAPR